MRKKSKPPERYSITIYSLTDVKKKPSSFHILRRRLIAAGGVVVFAALFAIGVATVALIRVSGFSGQTATESQMADASEAFQTSDSMISGLAQQEEITPSILENNTLPSAQPTTESILCLLPEYESEIRQSLVAMRKTQDVTQENLTKETAAVPGSITISNAINKINTSFNEQVSSKIESVKANIQFDKFQTEYTGDVEGDSDTVNNWADVIAIYAVETGTELRGLTTIPEKDMELLESIYDSMNVIEVSAKTTTQKSPSTNAEETLPVTTLTSLLSVESLTYEEGAELQGFSKEQKLALEELMSTSYYAVFAELLGIDYYDNLDADQLTVILTNLEEGTTGAAIVQAALTRVGNPYSKGKRGSGRYVDCSYFAWWVYDQAGVVIPTSSVEQARYCYNNGCAVELEDLLPGDLIFWSKKCSCGRWHEIHHTAIYLGGNKVIEASSSRGRVVINELWSGGEWRIFMGARPYAQ